MEAIISALEEEMKEAKKLISKYERELKGLPKGAFFVRSIGRGDYGYITCSIGGKVHQKYLGKMSDARIKKYQAKMERTSKLKSLLKSARENLNFLRKALRHAHARSKGCI